jgi:hypothetical protein
MRLTADILGKTMRRWPAIALFCALALPVFAQTNDLLPAAPVDHFRLYGFDEKNGWRSWVLEGARADLRPDGSVSITGMKLRIFEANERQNVNLTIESPLARMPRTRDRIEGPDAILLTAKGIYLSGLDWLWKPEEKRLFIKNKTHLVIEGEVGPVLE